MPDELQELISAVCDGRASDAEFARLAQLLRSDPDARDTYLRYVDLHAALSDEALPAFESDLVDYRPGAAASVGIKPESDKPNAVKQAGWGTMMRWFAVAAAVVLIAGTATLMMRGRTNGSSDGTVDVVASRAPIATMLLAEGCRWEGADRQEGQRLDPGRCSLLEGTAVMRFDGGAELVLVGPATIELQTAGSVLVHFGDVVVRATDGAEGFAVLTPTSEVVDLGTEFAVKVSRSGATEVHVLDGEVKYRRLNASEELSKILRAGEGVAIDAEGRPAAVPMNSPRFQEFVNRVNPRSRADLLFAYEGFNYSPGVLPLAESTVGIGWAGPWRRRTPEERVVPASDESPGELEIVHGQMNVTWQVPGGRLGMLRLPEGGVFYVRPLERAIDLDRDGVTFIALMVRETERRIDKGRPRERLRLTLRSSTDYLGDVVSFGHGPGYRPTVQTGDGVGHVSPLVLPAEQTTLWIGKIVSRRQGEDEIFFRVYGEEDALGYAEPATWHVVTRGVDLASKLDLVLLSSVGKTARIIDELRIGPTWRSVAPIEEQKK